MLDHHKGDVAAEAHEWLTEQWARENIPWIKPSLPDRLHRRLICLLDRYEAAAGDTDGWWCRHAWTVLLAATVAVWVGIGLALGWAL